MKREAWVIGAISTLLVIAIGLYQRTKYLEGKWETAEANVKAYSSELSASGNKYAALRLTVDQLSYFNDSILEALDATRKELKIKDKNLKALQAISSSFSRKDTIKVLQVDTLFKEPTLAIDTVIGDQWYSVRLGLKYPSMIAIQPEFKSEKHIVVSNKKGTVNPPKKFFLFRWFQKRHIILKIDVIEKNPYVDNESSRYVEIIK